MHITNASYLYLAQAGDHSDRIVTLDAVPLHHPAFPNAQESLQDYYCDNAPRHESNNAPIMFITESPRA